MNKNELEHVSNTIPIPVPSYGEVTLHSQNSLELDTSAFVFDSSSDTPFIDQILNHSKCFKLWFKGFSFASLTSFVEGLEVSLSGLLFIPILSAYQVSKVEGCLITSSLMLSMAFGSLFSGWFSEKGRRKVIISQIISIFLATLLSCIPHVIVLFVCRTIIGISLGLIIPVVNNHFCEVLPTGFRSFWIIFVTVFFSLGAIVSCALMHVFNYATISKPEISLYFFILSVLIGGICVIVIYFFEENPRYLILNGRHCEGFEMLEKLLGKKIEEGNRTMLVKQLLEGGNKNAPVRWSVIFSNEYRKLTAILTSIWMLYSVMVNGGVFSLFVGLLYSTSVIPEATEMKSDDYSLPFIIFYSIFMISTVLSGLMTEIRCCGRKYSILLGFLTAAVICIFAIFADEDYFYFGLGALFINISFNAINSYTMEVYPTRVRDFAVGFVMFLSRLTGLLSNVSALFIYLYSSIWHLYLNAVIGILGFILTLFLPFDTYQRPLDKKIEAVGTNENVLERTDLINSNN